jgi:hypothetical protein
MKNPERLIVPVAARSFISSIVIKKPDKAKKTFTPMWALNAAKMPGLVTPILGQMTPCDIITNKTYRPLRPSNPLIFPFIPNFSKTALQQGFNRERHHTVKRVIAVAIGVRSASRIASFGAMTFPRQLYS